jgi:hypothetical protein
MVAGLTYGSDRARVAEGRKRERERERQASEQKVVLSDPSENSETKDKGEKK